MKSSVFPNKSSTNYYGTDENLMKEKYKCVPVAPQELPRSSQKLLSDWDSSSWGRIGKQLLNTQEKGPSQRSGQFS